MGYREDIAEFYGVDISTEQELREKLKLANEKIDKLKMALWLVCAGASEGSSHKRYMKSGIELIHNLEKGE